MILHQNCREASILNKEWEAVPHSLISVHACVERHCNQAQGRLGVEPLPPFSGEFQENGKTGSAGEKETYFFF